MCIVIRLFATSLVIRLFADTYGDGRDGDGGACEVHHHHLHGPQREITAIFGLTTISDVCCHCRVVILLVSAVCVVILV